MTPMLARAILDVGDQPSSDELKRKWRSLALIHHPDRGGDVAMFRRLVEAYQYLINRPETGLYTNHRQTPRQSATMLSGPSVRRKSRVSPQYWQEQAWLEEEFGHLGYWTREGIARPNYRRRLR